LKNKSKKENQDVKTWYRHAMSDTKRERRTARKRRKTRTVQGLTPAKCTVDGKSTPGSSGAGDLVFSQHDVAVTACSCAGKPLHEFVDDAERT
jgi:hypothetical protein